MQGYCKRAGSRGRLRVATMGSKDILDPFTQQTKLYMRVAGSRVTIQHLRLYKGISTLYKLC